VSHRYGNFLLMMGKWMPETCRGEKQINILNRIVHPVGFIYEIMQSARSTKHKTLFNIFYILVYHPKKQHLSQYHSYIYNWTDL